MRVFKTRRFAQFARRERITDASLGEAVRRAAHGLIDADLEGGVMARKMSRLTRQLLTTARDMRDVGLMLVKSSFARFLRLIHRAVCARVADGLHGGLVAQTLN